MITGNESMMPYQGLTEDLDKIAFTYPGLTIRQHFAAMAMQGLLSQHIKEIDSHSESVRPVYEGKYINTMFEDINGFEDMAIDSVFAADALIKELNKSVENSVENL